MESTILPNNRKTWLPITPRDGQVFVDKDFVRWVYNSDLSAWERSGTVDAVPLATGDTVGYMSSDDKRLLDGTKEVGGDFGLIVDTKLILQSPTNPDGIIQGDIELRSDSLDITCVDPNNRKLKYVPKSSIECVISNEDGTYNAPGLSFKLSKKFLDTLYINIPGPKGKEGFFGDKGEQGEPGWSEGPQGLKGKPGADIDELYELTGIKLTNKDGMTDESIVDLKLMDDNGHGCKLVVTKSKLNISGNEPADKIIAGQISRSVVYPDNPNENECSLTRMNNFRIVKPSSDSTPLNIQLLRLPKGSNDREEPIGFNAFSLTDFVNGVVGEYMDQLVKIDAAWGKQVKEYIEGIDDKARTILSSLANELAMCEFNLPAVEYGIVFEECYSYPEIPPTPPADQSKMCDELVNYISGTESFPHRVSIYLGPGTGIVEINYNMMTVPDKLIAIFDSQTVIDTGYRGSEGNQNRLDLELDGRGLPSETIAGPGLGSASFNKTTNSEYLLCELYGPLSGTIWNFTVRCPISSSKSQSTTKSKVSNLAAITAYYNFSRSENRINNYKKFARHMEDQGIPLWTIEAAMPGAKFDIPEGERVKRVVVKDPLWHKEKLLNILLKDLPEEFDAVAWLDSDVLFEPDLKQKTINALNTWKVVQLFATAKWLKSDGDMDRVMAGIGYKNSVSNTKLVNSSMHTGFAWAARREVLRSIGGIFDSVPTVSSDVINAVGFYGDFDSNMMKVYNKHVVSSINDWAKDAYDIIGGDVGFVHGVCQHLYHGGLTNRHYNTNSNILYGSGFNPKIHLKLADGLYELTKSCPVAVRDWFNRFMLELRKEDE